MFKVTIGIPVYNEEKYIHDTLSSILIQFKSFSSIEVIISNNASTDSSLKIINNFIESNPDIDNFKVFDHPKNIGATENFWFVFDKSISDYFIWVGAHDILSEDFINIGYNFLINNPEFSMFSGSHMKIDENNNILNSHIPYSFDSEGSFNRYKSSLINLSNCYIFHSLFNKNFLNNYPRYNAPSEDHIIISRLLWNGKLFQSKDCAYVRRYLPVIDRIVKNNEGRYVNPMNNVEFLEAYLSDLSLLSSDLSPFVQKAIINHTSELLIKRFGVPHVTS
jgi:protein O-GlcNAc transferase